MAASALQKLPCAVIAPRPAPRLAVFKDRTGELPAGIRLERWASRLLTERN